MQYVKAMTHFSQNHVFRSHLLLFWVGLLATAIALSGCGRKAPLYIPTEAQKTQMEKEQAERDAVLKARAERAKKAEAEKSEVKTDTKTDANSTDDTAPNTK